jgi:hypothetical protein
MTLQDALKAIARRSRRPAILGFAGGMLLFNVGMVALSILVRRFVPPSAAMPPTMLNARMFLSGLLGSGFMFMVSPFGWQWTGDDRQMARPGRALLQVLGLHILY